MGAYNIVNAGSLVAGQNEDVSQVLANFTAIATVLNGGLDDSNVNAAAALAVTKLALGANGNRLSVVGGANVWATPARYGNRPADPGTTASGTMVMMGLGALATITPAISGNILFIIKGLVSNSGGANAYVQGYIGTGAAPVNGAAAVGTLFDALQGASGTGFPAPVSGVPFTVCREFTGFVIGTPYWIDLAIAGNAGNTSVTNLSIAAREL